MDILLDSFYSESLDLILCLEVLEHLPESPRKILPEFNRFLKPGRKLIFATPIVANLKHRIDMIFGKPIYSPISNWFLLDSVTFKNTSWDNLYVKICYF